MVDTENEMKHVRWVQIGGMFSCLVLLGACSGFRARNCNKPEVYAAAENRAPLRIPVGLDGPDTRAALKIPELNEPEVPRGQNDNCLEEPPPLATPAAKPAR
jgi:uncharacterized lipoprotein